VDPEDGLLRQGAAGYQLTWMDAKVGDWVVTPRRGKAVEINALWYNALRLLEGWLREEGVRGQESGVRGQKSGVRGQESGVRSQGSAGGVVVGPEPLPTAYCLLPTAHCLLPTELAEHAGRARQSFNKRFWYDDGGYLYDVVDGDRGDDAACRPNQLLAVSLPHPVLDPRRWPAVVETARQRLLTPVGLRSLAPGHPDYKAKYDGDLRARDAAYHQGTVWAWLIGPFIDAWIKVHPEDRGARRFLSGFVDHLSQACVGSISEVFDAEEPFTPRGCVAQAWSVAEVLRCWAKTA
jgi:glycogen debranching enzyme